MPSMTKTALYVMIGSVVLSALLGIMAILSGDWGWYEFRILFTTITISGASICILASVALWERKNTRPLPFLGIALSLVGAILMIWGIWTEPGGDVFWKLTVSIVVYAIATAHLCLLSLARLSKNYAWALWLAYLVIYGLATIITWMIVDENSSTEAFQFLGVVSILVGGVSILIPIFQKFSAFISDDASSAKAVKIICPQCGNEQANTLGEITCEKCQSVFIVKILRVGSLKAES
ncbi:MAG: hypothetical protein HYR70_06300 [Chloroflexi bacterium]|nr:hypothetical protein [Chloroflexota bacterium]MBI3338846.1 hypothetical protein [Chloroflexota bacterium]